MRKKSREKEYLDNLERIIRRNYVKLERNIPYSTSTVCGELDLLALREDGNYDYYEVKANETPRAIYKARGQILRARKNLNYIADTYIYYGNQCKIEKYPT